jgi:hypothetical protein
VRVALKQTSFGNIYANITLDLDEGFAGAWLLWISIGCETVRLWLALPIFFTSRHELRLHLVDLGGDFWCLRAFSLPCTLLGLVSSAGVELYWQSD